MNPATGQTLAEAPLATEREVDAAVTAAARAFDAWRFTPPTQRARLMWHLADLLEANKDEFATIEVLDNGKPMWEAQAVDIALTIELLRYYAGWTTKIEGEVLPNSIPGMLTVAQARAGRRRRRDHAVELPAARGRRTSSGPALAAGCTVVVKPSELAPLSTLRLMELIDEAGFPPGVVNVVIGGPDVGAALVRHPGVDKIAFTGQTATGKEIMRTAVDGLKRVTLELGGKSPNIVFADADLDAAAERRVRRDLLQPGAGLRRGLAPVRRGAGGRGAGRPRRRAGRDDPPGLGPGSRDPDGTADLRGAPHAGARLRRVRARAGRRGRRGRRRMRRCRGSRAGSSCSPPCCAGVRNDMKVAQEEIFGPVLSVIPFDDEDELLTLANANDYGLAAGIWTSDVNKALRVADRLDAGTVWINTYGMFDVAVPFGGRKHSGFGRELGEEALEPYLHSKSVWVDLTAAVPQSGQGISR